MGLYHTHPMALSGLKVAPIRINHTQSACWRGIIPLRSIFFPGCSSWLTQSPAGFHSLLVSSWAVVFCFLSVVTGRGPRDISLIPLILVWNHIWNTVHYQEYLFIHKKHSFRYTEQRRGTAHIFAKLYARDIIHIHGLYPSNIGD